MGLSLIESSYNFTTMISPTLVRYCEIYLDISSNSLFEKNLREGGPRNVHRGDKKMRGHSNVTMCEWLINSFFTFCDWVIYIQQVPKAKK